jgi:hypothetical protein
MDRTDSAVKTVTYSISQIPLFIQFLLQTPGALNMKEWAGFLPLMASLTIQVRFTNMAACEGKQKFDCAKKRPT